MSLRTAGGMRYARISMATAARRSVYVFGAVRFFVAVGCGSALFTLALPVPAATLEWKGITWETTSGGMAGVCEGDPANVSVDASGNLHLQLRQNGGQWTAAELFTTERLGFGTYQWQIEGPIDRYDANVVLGLFPYGPAHGIGMDGTNEIDIEFARWGYPSGPNGDFTNYPASGSTIGEHSFSFALSGTLATARFNWTSTSITDFLFDGLEPIDGSGTPLEIWTYTPEQPSTNIPQEPLPLGMNLWCFDAPPSDGNPVEIVVRDFQFVPEGASPGTGGAGGAGGLGGTGAGGTGAGTAGADSDTGGAPSGGSGGASASTGVTSVTSVTDSTGVTGASVTSGGSASQTANSVQGSLGASSTGSPNGTGGSEPADSGGCGCRLATGSRTPHVQGWPWLVAVLLLGCRRVRCRVREGHSRAAVRRSAEGLAAAVRQHDGD